MPPIDYNFNRSPNDYMVGDIELVAPAPPAPSAATQGPSSGGSPIAVLLSHALSPWDRGTWRPEVLVECATLILATGLKLIFRIQKPVLLRLLAEPTGARPSDAELGCDRADGDAAAK
jgi:hypothetical protein